MATLSYIPLLFSVLLMVAHKHKPFSCLEVSLDFFAIDYYTLCSWTDCSVSLTLDWWSLNSLEIVL